MKRLGSSLRALSFLGVLLAPAVALAQAYRWVDEQGKVHYSEGLDSVPARYRATAKPIDFPKAPPPPPPAAEKSEGDKKSGAPAESAQPSPAEKAGSGEPEEK